MDPLPSNVNYSVIHSWVILFDLVLIFHLLPPGCTHHIKYLSFSISPPSEYSGLISLGLTGLISLNSNSLISSNIHCIHISLIFLLCVCVCVCVCVCIYNLFESGPSSGTCIAFGWCVCWVSFKLSILFSILLFFPLCILGFCH